MSINRAASLSSYHALFPIIMPKTIKVSYQTPSTDKHIIDVDPQVFAKKQGMKEWVETVLIDKPLLNPFIKDQFPGQTIDQQTLNKILSRTQLNQDKLLISYMNDAVGWGVFACDTIEESDYVSIYSGVQFTVNPQKQFPYEQGKYFYIIDEEDIQIGAIDPKEYGNVSRFYQHLPMPTLDKISPFHHITIEDYEFNSLQDKATVATANLLAIPFKYQHSSVIVLQAMRQIEKNECIGFDYGNFWLNYGQHPSLFNKDGTLLNPEKYRPNRWLCRTYPDNSHTYFIQVAMDHTQLLLKNTDYEFKNEQLICKISAATFSSAFANTPSTSPYIFINQPDEIKFLSAPFTPPKKPIVNNIEKSIFQPGFFGKIDQQICEELSRITHRFPNIKWVYHQGKQLAFLRHTNNEIIKEIEAYLKAHGCQTQSGRDKDTKHPLLYVNGPKLTHLRQIEDCQLPIPVAFHC